MPHLHPQCPSTHNLNSAPETHSPAPNSTPILFFTSIEIPTSNL
jgi:hypothetical protein